MAEIPLDPSLIKVSPGFADAVKNANLPPASRNMVEQMSQTYVKASKLLKLGEERARKEFLDLDPIVQTNIRTLHPNQKRFEAEQGLIGKALQLVGNAATGTAKGLFSPIILGFKTAGITVQASNTLGNVYQQTKYQDKPFTKKVLSNAYNGLNQWRWDDVAVYEKKYGKALTTLARGAAEFKTPGESVDLYGNGLDAEMYEALVFQVNEPVKFQKLIDEIKQGAQLSPGRNLAQTQTNIGGNSNSWAVKVAKKLGFDVTTREGQEKASKFISGPIDAAYQILNPTDPLNWIGVGPIIKATTKGVGGIKVGLLEAVQFGGFRNRGERLAQQYQFIAERGGDMGIKEATRFVFGEKDVVKLWDDQLGPAVKRFADAETKAEKGIVYRGIRDEFPEWANEGVVRELASAGAFDAPTAQRFFQMGENGRYLLGLRVDGTDFYRSGIPVARRSRIFRAALQQNITKTLSGDLTDEELKLLDISAKEAVDKLKLTAATEDNLLSPMLDEINRINKEIDTTVRRTGRMLSRTPGRILYGPDAIKTIDEVRNLLHVVGFPRHYADVMAEHFVDESVEYQVTMIRNLYAAYYKKIGINGQVNGDNHIDELLNSTFNEQVGMTSLARVEIPQGWESELPRAIYKYDNDIPILTSRGIIHPAQIAEGIAPINFDLALQFAAADKFGEISFLNFVNGITRHPVARRYNDEWTRYTLFPRAGIRNSIDEISFAALNEPISDLLALATAPLNTVGAQIKVATTVTGSSAGIGMYKRGVYKMFPHLDPRKKLPAETRRKIIEDLAGDGPIGNVLQAEIMESTIDRAVSFYGKTLPKETWEGLRLVMKHNPHMIDSLAQSVSAKASMSSKIDVEYIDSMFTGNAWDRFFLEEGLKKSKTYTPRELSKMKDKERAMSFYDNWQMFFAFNGQKVAPGVYINPTPFFFVNNGLRDSRDLTRARRAMLEQLGIRYDEETGLLVPRKDTELVTKFISPYSTTAYYRQQGLSDIDIADAVITNILIDMKTLFHGTTNGFNDTLFNLISKKRAAILREAEIKNQTPFDTWSKAIEVTDFKEFEDATLGMIPTSGLVNSRLINIRDVGFDAKAFEEFEGFNGALERFGNWTMDVMDAQVTGTYRQKMLWIKLTRNLKELKPFQANIAKDHLDNLIAMNPNPGPNFLKRAKKQADDLAEKQVVELAWSDSMNTLLRYVDNPVVRSNLAVSVRATGRFYRATEDFYRRVFRLYTKAPLRTLYRMRLLHQGLEANGDVYTDEQGNDYIIFPTDVIISSVLEPVVRQFTGNDSFKIPVFNDLALKLRLINPSFSPDAGQPTLSGPIAAVSMLAIKAILRNDFFFLPSSIKEKINVFTDRAADEIDTIALGNIGASLDLQRALTPMLFQGVWGSIQPAEKDRQKHSAGLQAISYLAAFGNGAPVQKDYIGRENEFVKAESEYLKNVRWAASTIVIFRNMMGQISPGQPSLRETTTLPEFLKQAGLTSPNAEFWDIYNSVLKNDSANSNNAWDLALATFVGKNPGRAAFIEPRNNKEYGVFINKTDNVKNWAEKNTRFVDDYKEAAWLFAPKVGEYNPDVYTWMKSFGLVSLPSFENYLDQVRLAVDKSTYFKIKDSADEQLKVTNDTTLRQLIIADSERARSAMLAANPMLKAEIKGNLDNQGNLDNRLYNLNAAIRDPKAPISKELRATFRFAIDEINGFVAFANDNDNKDAFDYSGRKESEKARVQAIIDELSKSVPEIKEASRLILTPLLNTYSRDVISAAPKKG